jgi:acyl-CoA thioester hydrolase
MQYGDAFVKDGWFVVPWQVIFRDLDAFGHVNNAVYLTYFEWARARLWFALSGSATPGAISFIMARAEIDYRAPVELEPIELAVRVGEMRNTSFDTHYEIRNRNGKQIAATGTVVAVLFDWKRNTKMQIPDELREKVRTMFRSE